MSTHTQARGGANGRPQSGRRREAQDSREAADRRFRGRRSRLGLSLLRPGGCRARARRAHHRLPAGTRVPRGPRVHHRGVTGRDSRMNNEAVTLVSPEALTDTAPYAYAAVAPPGARLVFTAGACPLDDAGETVAPGDVAAQTEQV